MTNLRESIAADNTCVEIKRKLNKKVPETW